MPTVFRLSCQQNKLQYVLLLVIAVMWHRTISNTRCTYGRLFPSCNLTKSPYLIYILYRTTRPFHVPFPSGQAQVLVPREVPSAFYGCPNTSYFLSEYHWHTLHERLKLADPAHQAQSVEVRPNVVHRGTGRMDVQETTYQAHKLCLLVCDNKTVL